MNKAKIDETEMTNSQGEFTYENNGDLESPDTQDAPNPSKWQGLKKLVRDVFPALIISYLIFGVLINIVIVSGGSMNPTLSDGEVLIMQHAFYSPHKGDIVVATPPEYGMQIVKRVIATEGDIINIDYNTGEVTVNGEVIQEEYINERTCSDLGMPMPATVPQGTVFLMGDNRNNSYDSRFPLIGFVPVEDIRGGLLFGLFN